MLQALLVTGVTPLHDKDEIHNWENRPFSGVTWIETSSRKTEITRNRTIKKKCKRVRTAFTTDQIRALEKTFLLNKYINSENRQELSKKLNIGEKCIKIWFQNRRMKEKRASSESSDTSSEVYGREAISPLLETTDAASFDSQPTQCKTPLEMSPYFQPLTFQAYNEKPEAQIYENNNIFIQNVDYSNSFAYYNETNPYTQFYQNGEADVNAYVHQNQFQYSNEMYNWCANDMDLYNFYQ